MRLEDEIKQKKFISEYQKMVINIVYTNNWLGTMHAPHMDHFGLSMQQYNILRILNGQHPNPASVNLLIERMIDKSSNASRIVDKLEEKGFVDRRKCANDRRAVDVIISQLGLDILETMDQELSILEKDMKTLSEEEAEQLNVLLDKIRS